LACARDLVTGVLNGAARPWTCTGTGTRATTTSGRVPQLPGEDQVDVVVQEPVTQLVGQRHRDQHDDRLVAVTAQPVDEEAVRQEGGNQVVVLDDLGEVGAFGIAIEVQRAGPVNSELLRLWLRAVPGGPAAAAAGWTAGASPQPYA
jgi:hypothetical protein